MTNEQLKTVVKALTAVFGECKYEVNADDLEIYFEARGAPVVIGLEPVEVDSVNGPMTVAGFRVGIYNEDGEFEMEVATADLWEAIIVAQGLIAESILQEVRWSGFSYELEQQYE